MNPNNPEDKAVMDYAAKHGCTIAAARFRMAAEKPKEQPAEEVKRPLDTTVDEEIAR